MLTTNYQKMSSIVVVTMKVFLKTPLKEAIPRNRLSKERF